LRRSKAVIIRSLGVMAILRGRGQTPAQVSTPQRLFVPCRRVERGREVRASPLLLSTCVLRGPGILDIPYVCPDKNRFLAHNRLPVKGLIFVHAARLLGDGAGRETGQIGASPLAAKAYGGAFFPQGFSHHTLTVSPCTVTAFFGAGSEFCHSTPKSLRRRILRRDAPLLRGAVVPLDRRALPTRDLSEAKQEARPRDHPQDRLAPDACAPM